MTLFSPLLSQLPWVEHGFGTRNDTPSQDGMASLEQVHSSVTLVAGRIEEGGPVGKGDALVTNQPGLAVSVRTADCFPSCSPMREIKQWPPCMPGGVERPLKLLSKP